MLRRRWWPKREEVIGEWRSICEELYSVCSLPDIFYVDPFHLGYEYIWCQSAGCFGNKKFREEFLGSINEDLRK
jgi:hypothetical protein